MGNGVMERLEGSINSETQNLFDFNIQARGAQG